MVNINYFIKSAEYETVDIEVYQNDLILQTGLKFDSAFSFISQAFSELGNTDNDYQRYAEVSVNIWLGKGVHHFIQCIDSVNNRYSEFVNPQNSNNIEWNFQALCTDFTAYGSDGHLREGTGTDTDEFGLFEFTGKFMKIMPAVDTFRFYFRPMDCSYVNSFFTPLQKYADDETLFYENCVNFTAGDPKPQIRVANTFTYFNISNYAQFENISFTGEDLFATLHQRYDDVTEVTAYGNYPQSALAFWPKTKCKVREEPTNPFQKLDLHSIGTFPKPGSYVNCSDGWVEEEERPPLEQDQRCFETQDNGRGTAHCSGDPNHELFFYWDGYSYPYRYKTLFNLYSFDSFRSQRATPPVLQLINCEFQYFLGGHDSLINVETNNFGIFGLHWDSEQKKYDTLDENSQFLSYYGEDRGARISITNSTFKHSSFCKGMINYKRTEEVKYDDVPQMLNFTANGQKPDYQYDLKTLPFILMENTTVDNIAFHEIVDSATLKEWKTQTNQNLSGVIDYEWRTFKNRGLVMNLQGFHGSVRVAKSKFTRNMVYVKEILIEPSLTTKEFYNIDDGDGLSNFAPDDKVLKFKVCRTDGSYLADYYFSDVIDPDTEFDDSLYVKNMEQMSPFFIYANGGPMLFLDNDFEENIGTTGGAIHIEQPNFEVDLDSYAKAYIIVQGNKFKNNMAYVAGNAIHITNKMRMIVSGQDSRQTCGNGILIEDNFFHGNIGMKKHNGGALVIRCQHLVSQEEFDEYDLINSGVIRDEVYQEVSKYLQIDLTPILEDPTTTWLTIDDPVTDYAYQYKILKYGTFIFDNSFSNNYAGMRGTAILIDNISEVQIQHNRFTDNGPVTASKEIQYSPYYKYMTDRKRTISFYVKYTDVWDEAKFFNKEWIDEMTIDMPMVQGAVYIRNCNDVSSCFGLQEDFDKLAELEALGEKTEDEIALVLPWNRVLVEENYFYDNHANIIITALQTVKQSSSLFIVQGLNNTIINNQFFSHKSDFDAYYLTYAWDLYRYMPDDYFKKSHAPVIRIEQKLNSFTSKLGKYIGKDFQTKLIGNEFADNQNYQIVTMPQLAYHGSLLEYDCEVDTARLGIEQNTVSENAFIGKQGALFYITGGLVTVNSNYFGYNGYLSNKEISNHPEDKPRQWKTTYFPFGEYIFDYAQNSGIFTFDFNYFDVPKYQAHNISENIFEHIYCSRGCAYSSRGTKAQQFAFNDNTYQYMVSKHPGAVFDGSELALYVNNEFSSIWVQTYRNERIYNTFGGAIYVTSTNQAITIIEDTEFVNNFGDQGASLSFFQGGGLFTKNCVFNLDSSYGDYIRHFVDFKFDEGEEIYNEPMATKANLLKTGYQSTLPREYLVDDDYVEKVINQIQNIDGQIRLMATRPNLKNTNQPLVSYDKKLVGEFLLEQFNLDILKDKKSALINSGVFYGVGQKASAIAIYDSSIDLLATEDQAQEPNFSNNVAPAGSTVYASGSIIRARYLKMQDNQSKNGGCVQLDSGSQMDVTDSSFEQNAAEIGGVIYAIANSRFNIQNTQIIGNFGFDASAVYGMANNQQFALQFYNSTFLNNYGEQNLIHLSLSEMYIEHSVFIDNYARFVNHGITLLSSLVEMRETEVRFSEGFADSLDLARLDTGFFNLFPASTVYIKDNTIFRNLRALNQAVLNAISQSNVYISNNVTFINNTLSSEGGQTIGLQNTRNVQISGAHFAGNQQTNLQIELGTITVEDSTFTDGPEIHLVGREAEVHLDKVVIFNSSAPQSEGHGFTCSFCERVQIINSTFYNLTSLSGSAIILNDLQKNNSVIKDNHFEANRAISYGGAIYLLNPMQTKVEGNTFKRNLASPIMPSIEQLTEYYQRAREPELSDNQLRMLQDSSNDTLSLPEAQTNFTFADQLKQMSDKQRLDVFISQLDEDSAESQEIEDARSAYFEYVSEYLKNELYQDTLFLTGGAVMYQCQRGHFDTCDVQLVGNLFEGNMASNGGALRWLNNKFNTQVIQNGTTIVDTNDYKGNFAIYGTDQGSYPAAITYDMIDDDIPGTGIDLSTKEIRIAPGQKFKFIMKILDKDGNVYNNEQRAIATIDFKSRDNLSESSVVIGRDAVAKDGVFTFGQLLVRIKPNSTATITISFQDLSSFGNSIDFLQSPPTFSVSARECVRGEKYTDDLACIPCPQQFYLYEACNKTCQCLDCPTVAYCHGSYHTSPKPGYWRSDPFKNNFISCLRYESCLGGDQDNPLGICDVGYNGILCANCDPGYFKSGEKACNLCPSVLINFVLFTLILLAVVGVIVLLVRSQLYSVAAKKPVHSVYYKIFMNHFQLIAAVSSINFSWPSEIAAIISTQQKIADSPATVLSFDCLLMDLVFGQSPSFRLNYVKIIMYALLPVIILGVSALYWWLHGLCTRMKSTDVIDRINATTIIVTFLFYPTIVKVIAQSMNCYTIDDQARLFEDLEELCYTGTHFWIMVLVSIPAIMIWAVGIPIYALLKLKVNLQQLATLKEKTENTQEGGVAHQMLIRRFKIRLGFLTAGYRDDLYYWEIVLLIRKTVIVLLLTFLQPVSSGVQSLTAIMIFVIFFMIQVKLRPYYDDSLNNMESISLFVLIMTIYCGLYYQAGQGEAVMQQNFVKWTIFTMVLAPSLVFIVYFLYKMRIEILKIALNQSPKAFRFVTCGFMDINQFRDDHMKEDEKEIESESDEYDVPQAEQLRGFKYEQRVFESEPSPLPDKEMDDSRSHLKRLNESSVVESEKPNDKHEMIFPEHVKIRLEQSKKSVSNSSSPKQSVKQVDFESSLGANQQRVIAAVAKSRPHVYRESTESIESLSSISKTQRNSMRFGQNGPSRPASIFDKYSAISVPQTQVQDRDGGAQIKVIPMDDVIINADIKKQPGRQATKSRLEASIVRSEQDLKDALRAINAPKNAKQGRHSKRRKVIEVSDADLSSESEQAANQKPNSGRNRYDKQSKKQALDKPARFQKSSQEDDVLNTTPHETMRLDSQEEQLVRKSVLKANPKYQESVMMSSESADEILAAYPKPNKMKEKPDLGRATKRDDNRQVSQRQGQKKAFKKEDAFNEDDYNNLRDMVFDKGIEEEKKAASESSEGDDIEKWQAHLRQKKVMRKKDEEKKQARGSHNPGLAQTQGVSSGTGGGQANSNSYGQVESNTSESIDLL